MNCKTVQMHWSFLKNVRHSYLFCCSRPPFPQKRQGSSLIWLINRYYFIKWTPEWCKRFVSIGKASAKEIHDQSKCSSLYGGKNTTRIDGRAIANQQILEVPFVILYSVLHIPFMYLLAPALLLQLFSTCWCPPLQPPAKWLHSNCWYWAVQALHGIIYDPTSQ